LQAHHPLVASGTHAVPVVWTSMATYFYGHPIPRTDRQCTRPGRDAEFLGGRPTLVLQAHHLCVASGTHAVPVVWTSMATYFYGHPIPRTDRQCTLPGRDAELLGGRPTLRLQAHHPCVASGTRAVPVVWTSMATYFYGHPIPRTDRQCTRPGRDAELLGGRPTLFCTHTTRVLRRGRTPYPWFGLLWPHTSMATQFRARTASAHGPVGMRNCWGEARHWFCRHATRVSRRGRTPYPWFGLLWPHTSMATQFRARTASARGPVGMRKC